MRYDITWPVLIEGILVRRYKRFMAEVRLRNGHTVTAHCPNTGSMLECSEPGRTVFLSHESRGYRKLEYTWEMIKMPTSLVGINTMLPNRLVKTCIIKGVIPGLAGFETIRTEVSYGTNSRIDILLEKGTKRSFIEIKNCTLVSEGTAFFPDAVSSRGLKHLIELQREVRKGHRAVMFYLVQRMDASIFRPAHHIDPAYGRELKRAVKNGVEVMVYDVIIDRKGVSLNRPLSINLSYGVK